MLTVIYCIGAAAVGFIFGLIVELFIDAEQVNRLSKNVEKLTLENIQLQQEAKHEAKPQKIEILDRRSIDAGDLCKPF
jgi:uncharacterized membrane protein (DUF106 family)